MNVNVNFGRNYLAGLNYLKMRCGRWPLMVHLGVCSINVRPTRNGRFYARLRYNTELDNVVTVHFLTSLGFCAKGNH